MTSKPLTSEENDKALAAFKLIDFNSVTRLKDIYQPLKYDVPEIHANIKEVLRITITKLKNNSEDKKSELVIPLIGSAGTGKTHLMSHLYNLARENNGFFIATDFLETNTIANDINIAACKIFSAKNSLFTNQLTELIKNILIESNIKFERDLEQSLGNMPFSDRCGLIDNVSDKLFAKYRAETQLFSDIIKAVFFLASDRLDESKKSASWLKSLDVKDLNPVNLKFDKPYETPEPILKGLTWLMSLNGGFTVIVIDQVDAFPDETKYEDKNTEIKHSRLGATLSRFHSDTYRTLAVLSTHSDAWLEFSRVTLQSYLDRFKEPPLYMTQTTKAELSEKIIEKRLKDAYQKAGFTPEYGTWPFPKPFFEKKTGLSPREILKKCNEYIQSCLKSGLPFEWPGLGGIDIPLPTVTELFEHISNNFDVNTINNEEEFWKKVFPLLNDCFKSDDKNRILNFEHQLHFPSLRLTTKDSSGATKSLSLWAITDQNIADIKKIIEKALDDHITDNINKNKIAICRFNDIQMSKAEENIIQKLNQRNGDIFIPDDNQIRELQALIEVYKKYPETWNGWVNDYNPLKKIKYLRDEFDWLLVENEIQNFEIGIARKIPSNEVLPISSDDLRRHTAIFGSTGSGKTVLLRRILEETALRNIPCIVIDVKGDLTTIGEQWKTKPPGWESEDDSRAKEYFKKTETVIWTPDNENGNQFSLPLFLELREFKNDSSELKSAKDENCAVLQKIIERRIKHGENAVLHHVMERIANNDTHFNITNLQREIETFIDDDDDNENITESMRRGAGTILESIKNLRFTHTHIFEEHFNNISELIKSDSNKTKISVLTLCPVNNDKKKQIIVENILNSFYTFIKNNHPQFLNAMLFIDEAHNFVPSRKTTRASDIILKIAAESRQYGFGMVLATQSVNGIDTRVANCCNTKFIGKQTSPAYIKAAEETLGAKNTGVNKLNVGNFLLKMNNTPPTKPFIKVKTPQCFSHAPSNPPSIEVILKMARQSRKLTNKED
ncbi:MAG: DUF853 family protein [Deltaproteobacteria bacterium]|jgi:DNA replication protein DnaC|nr:DUF853 family protein [Deltaproteobacteria bacterium]